MERLQSLSGLDQQNICEFTYWDKRSMRRKPGGNKVDDEIKNEKTTQNRNSHKIQCIQTPKRFRIYYERICLLIFHHKLSEHPQP